MFPFPILKVSTSFMTILGAIILGNRIFILAINEESLQSTLLLAIAKTTLKDLFHELRVSIPPNTLP